MPIALRHRPRALRAVRYLAAAVCASLALTSVLRDRRHAAAAQNQPVVLVVQRDLPAGHTMRPSDVRSTHWPKALRPDGVITSPAALRRRRLAGPMRRGEPMTTTRLIGSDLLSALPRGTVEVTISLADPSVAEVVHAGDLVDVLPAAANWALDDARDSEAAAPTGLGNTPTTSAGTAVHRLLVLAVLHDVSGPGSVAGHSTSLSLAADPPTATRLVKSDRGSGFTVLGDPP